MTDGTVIGVKMVVQSLLGTLPRNVLMYHVNQNTGLDTTAILFGYQYVVAVWLMSTDQDVQTVWWYGRGFC